jgi:plastocyanin
MTDTTTTEDTKPSTGVEAAAPAELEPRAEARAPVPFWQRPLVERFLVPLLLPVAVVGGIVFYVLNVSRLFLAGHGHVPVVAGTVITVVILFGAALLSAAPKMRSSGVVLVTVGFIMAVTFGGWISLGSSETTGETVSLLGPDIKASEAREVVAAPGGALSFEPNEIAAPTGLVRFDVNFAAPGHTFHFHDPATRFSELRGTGLLSGVAYFPAEGTYDFFCSIPGHEAAGMKGVVTVSGPAVPLEQALVDAGNPPDAAGGGGH